MFNVFKLLYKKMLFKFSTIVLTFLSFLLFNIVLRLIGNFAKSSPLQTIFFNFNLELLNFYVSFFILFLLPIFIAVKAPLFISTDIESGEFLTIVSKPISRKRILIEKFLAFQFVNISWILTCLGIVYFIQLSRFPYPFIFNYVMDVIPWVLGITFFYQLILSVILITASLKFESTVMIGIGLGIAILNVLSRNVITSNAFNHEYNRNKLDKIASEITDEKHKKLVSGQNKYKSFYRHIDLDQHLRFVVFYNMAKSYSENKSVANYYNQEVITAKINKQNRDKIGKIVNKKVYIVKGYKNWFNINALYFRYAFIAFLFLLFGFFYFNKKDIY